MEEGRPLQNMAEAFKELSNRLNEFPEGEEAGLEVAAFVKACSSVSPLIRCLGGAFLYAEIEYVSKVIKISLICGFSLIVIISCDDNFTKIAINY